MNASHRCLLLVILFLVIFRTMWTGKCCPPTCNGWKIRSHNLSCNLETTGSYHCIKLEDGTIKEACMTPTLIVSSEEGCPKFVERRGRYFLSRPFADCPPDTSNCPGPDHRFYYTDELYKYSDCIDLCNISSVSETKIIYRYKNETSSTSTTGVISPGSKSQPVMGPSPLVESSSHPLLSAILIILILVLLLLLVVHRNKLQKDFLALKEYCSRSCCSRRQKKEYSTPQGSHRSGMGSGGM